MYKLKRRYLISAHGAFLE